jgi:murein DD-endopeptidase MepM/ murein hydrolase activator NlpD
MKKSKKWSHYLQKVRFKYKITVLNENTLEESWHVRLSRFSVFLYTSLFLLITFSILTALIVLTPMRFYLPGYNSTGDRSAIISEAMHVDSLVKQMDLQEKYLEVLKSIITGEIKKDSLPSLDSISLKERAELLVEKSKAEKEFVENYERDEKYNLSSIINPENKNVFVFFKPVTGVISSSFNPGDRENGISILTASNESVVSVLGGTVIYAAFTFDFGWVIQVQHDDNYISVYKNNTQLIKKPGDRVRAGEVIGFTGETAEKKSNKHFYFELWKLGKPVNPEEVIIF